MYIICLFFYRDLFNNKFVNTWRISIGTFSYLDGMGWARTMKWGLILVLRTHFEWFYKCCIYTLENLFSWPRLTYSINWRFDLHFFYWYSHSFLKKLSQVHWHKDTIICTSVLWVPRSTSSFGHAFINKHVFQLVTICCLR